MKLTPKQKAFVDEYLISGNITEAAEHGQGLIVRQSGKKLIRGTEGQVNRMSNDLISRQALLDDFRDTITEQSDTMDWMNMIARQKANHLNDGWISVDEKLPEVPDDMEDEYCPEFNVTIKGASRATTLKYSPDGAWFDDLGQVYVVIAWRPLPDLYRLEKGAEIETKQNGARKED